jgi:hypothetical protein
LARSACYEHALPLYIWLSWRVLVIGHLPAITYVPEWGSTEERVKAASPAERGRSEAKSLDEPEASSTIIRVMAQSPSSRHGLMSL